MSISQSSLYSTACQNCTKSFVYNNTTRSQLYPLCIIGCICITKRYCVLCLLSCVSSTGSLICPICYQDIEQFTVLDTRNPTNPQEVTHIFSTDSDSDSDHDNESDDDQEYRYTIVNNNNNTSNRIRIDNLNRKRKSPPSREKICCEASKCGYFSYRHNVENRHFGSHNCPQRTYSVYHPDNPLNPELDPDSEEEKKEEKGPQ
jgi:uncharacterized Zn finger protein (UPF0148 family)